MDPKGEREMPSWCFDTSDRYARVLGAFDVVLAVLGC
jgi:hypothetical protein